MEAQDEPQVYCYGELRRMKSEVRVLFVCLGNICRSPTAEGVFRKVVDDAGMATCIVVDSAGTHAYHTGEAPDRRAQLAAEKRGFDLSKIMARRVVVEDFSQFDLVLAMDQDNLRLLREQCPEEYADRVRLFLEFAADHDELEVPDPYYGGSLGFERVLDLIERASSGLLKHCQLRLDHPAIK